MDVGTGMPKLKVKAQGLKAALSSFQTIAAFIITKNVLDEVKTLAAKLQKRDQDIYEAYMMVHDIVARVKSLRSTIDTTFCSWYEEVLELAEAIGVTEGVPRKTSLMRNHCNTPSGCPQEHYKRAIAIPFLDSLINQLEERFGSE